MSLGGIYQNKCCFKFYLSGSNGSFLLSIKMSTDNIPPGYDYGTLEVSMLLTAYLLASFKAYMHNNLKQPLAADLVKK